MMGYDGGLKLGDRLPSIPVQRLTASGEIEQIDLSVLTATGTTILVALPGAFTPPCSDAHVPGYVDAYDAFRAEGVDRIVILACNDFFVMHAWEKQFAAPEGMFFVADGNGSLTAQIGMTADFTGLGLGIRSQRYAAILREGAITHLAVEPDAGAVSVSGAESVILALRD
jgi:peroxiredoxin (alkyl hydroperoxide reductase subunit C)